MGWITSSPTGEVVSDTCGFQTLSREWGSVYKLRVRTRVTEYRGLAESFAKNYGSDASAVTQTGGSYYFEHFTRKVERRKANAAGGWTVSITETWSALYKNNTWQMGAGSSQFTALDPTPLA